jgi:hypothetical protein
MRAFLTLLLLLTTTAVQAANRPVPFRVCLTQQQAAQVYKGKHLKYRQIGDERCWYAHLGTTPDKAEFIPRITGVAAAPPRLIITNRARVQEPASPSLNAEAFSYSEEDHESGIAGAFESLCGGPCPQLLNFQDRWRLK